MKLDFLGPERVARPAQPERQQQPHVESAGSSWSRAGDTEGPRDEVSKDGTEGSRVGVFGDGTKGSPAVAKSAGEARPPGGADPVVRRAVERLLDVGTLRCLERLRKQIEQVEKEGSPS